MDISLLDHEYTTNECNICYNNLIPERAVRYQLDDLGPICVATKICDECLDVWFETQNEHFALFVTKITNLQDCSKLLKALLEGNYGIPTRILDLKIFPHPEKLILSNVIDPEFGRKSEVSKLWIGSKPLDVSLRGAPKTSEEVRKVLSEIITILDEKLHDYECDDEDQDVTSIKNNLRLLEDRLR